MDFKDCEEDNRDEIFLFARCDREKEDWLRHFLAASRGDIYDEAASPYNKCDTDSKSSTPSGSPNKSSKSDDSPDTKNHDEDFVKIDFNSAFDNIIFPGASRTSSDFIQFIMAYVKIKGELATTKKKDDKAGTSTETSEPKLALPEDVLWTNLVIGRGLYGIIHDSNILEEIHAFLQKKLSAIKVSYA